MENAVDFGAYNGIIDKLRCPITKKIFLNPVLASDGVVYEKSKLFIRINKDGKSPKTGKELDYNIRNVFTIKSFINSLIESYPDLKDDVYKPEPEDKNIKIFYSMAKSEVKSLISTRRFSELKSFIGFDLVDIGREKVCDLLKKSPDDVLKHVIDSSKDLNVGYSGCLCGTCRPAWHFVNYVCRDGNNEICRYLFNKEGVNLEKACSDGWRPIHQVSQYKSSDSDLIIHLVSKGVDLFCENGKGKTPLEFFCKKNKKEAIIYALDKVDQIEGVLRDKMIKKLYKNYYISQEDREALIELINSKSA